MPVTGCTMNIHVNGKRWKDSSGNTYHSVKLWKDGEFLAYIPYEYGYGDHYQQTALCKLIELGVVSFDWRQFKDGTATISYDVTDVKRKRDL